MNKIKMVVVMLVGIIGGFIGSFFTCRRMVEGIIKEATKQRDKIYTVKMAVNSVYGAKNYYPDTTRFKIPDELSVRRKRDADKVLQTIQNIVDQWGFISVSDLYELIGYDGPHTYLENKYGWTKNMATSFEFVRFKNSYILRYKNPIILL